MPRFNSIGPRSLWVQSPDGADALKERVAAKFGVEINVSGLLATQSAGTDVTAMRAMISPAHNVLVACGENPAGEQVAQIYSTHTGDLLDELPGYELGRDVLDQSLNGDLVEFAAGYDKLAPSGEHTAVVGDIPRRLQHLAPVAVLGAGALHAADCVEVIHTELLARGAQPLDAPALTELTKLVEQVQAEMDPHGALYFSPLANLVCADTDSGAFVFSKPGYDSGALILEGYGATAADWLAESAATVLSSHPTVLGSLLAARGEYPYPESTPEPRITCDSWEDEVPDDLRDVIRDELDPSFAMTTPRRFILSSTATQRTSAMPQPRVTKRTPTTTTARLYPLGGTKWQLTPP